MSKNKTDITKKITKLYEKAKDNLHLGTSDKIDDYLTLSLDTFDELYPMYADETIEVKEHIIAMVVYEFVSVLLLSTAVQAFHAGQYKSGDNDEARDVFDTSGLLSYHAAMKNTRPDLVSE